MDSYRISENILYDGIYAMIHAPATIDDYFVAGEYILLLLSPKELQSDRNLFGYNMQGQLLWRFPQPPQYHGDNYISAVYFREDGLLYAYCINGVEFQLEAESGKIIRSALIK